MIELKDVEAPSSRRRLGKLAGIVLAVAFGIFIGRYVIPATAGQAPFQLTVSEDGQRQFVFPTFWEAWDALHSNYIGTFDDKDLFYGAVAGMVRAVGDPYTIFTDPEDSKQFRETLDGHFAGVGIEIGVRGGLVRVIAPLEGSPAKAAGIQAGDVVVAVDDEPVTPDSTIDEVVQSIRGPRGEQVKLTVARQEESETTTHDFTITRDIITVESVTLEVVQDNIAHIRVSSFNGDTTGQFDAAVSRIASQDIAGVVLDVRNNPGGFLQTAVDIASEFLPPGTLVVTEKGSEETEHITRGVPRLGDVPVVVLINQGSASASEILAGALQDKRGIPVVGEKSFGKGSVQELVPFRDGSSLRVTIAKWFTPSGTSIDEAGIEPSVTVEDNDETDADEQLQSALEELKKQAE